MRLLNVVARVGLRKADLDVVDVSHRRGGKALFLAENEVLRPNVRHPAGFVQLERHRLKRLRDVDAERLKVRRHSGIGLRDLIYIIAAIGTIAQIRSFKIAIKPLCPLNIHQRSTPFTGLLSYYTIQEIWPASGKAAPKGAAFLIQMG